MKDAREGMDGESRHWPCTVPGLVGALCCLVTEEVIPAGELVTAECPRCGEPIFVEGSARLR